MTTANKTTALVSLYVIAFLLTIFVPVRLLVAQETNGDNPFDQKPIESPSETGPESSQETVGNPGRSNESALAAVTKELAELIPSEGDLDPKVVSKLQDVTIAYAGRDMPRVRELLKEMNASTPLFPPVEMMVAALHFRANQNAAGFQALETAAKNAPDYPGVYFGFARMALNQNRLTDAGALVDKAGRIFGNGKFSEVETKHFRSQYYQIVTLVALKQDRLEKAARLAASFEKFAPSDARSLALSAEVACANGESEKSLTYLQRLREVKPNVRAPELIIAGWCRNFGREEESDNWMRKASSQYPDQAAIQIAVADWAITSEDFDVAMGAVEKAVKANQKELPGTLWIKGQIAFAKGDYPAAESALEQLYKINSRSAEISQQYALCLIESSDEEKRFLAQELATKNFQASPSNPRALAALGWIMYRRGEKQNAQQLFARVAQSGNMTAEAAYFLAVFVSENEDPGADRLLENAVQKKGYFMYRKPANELLVKVKADLAEGNGQDLPKPTE